MPETKGATKRRDERKKQLQGKLNPQQICFCKNYVLDSSSAMEAYLTAYPNMKSENGARVNASKLLQKPDIREYINILLDEQSDLIEISEKEIYRELKRMALSSESETVRLKAIKQLTELKGMIQTGDTTTNNTLIQIGLVDKSGNTISLPDISEQLTLDAPSNVSFNPFPNAEVVDVYVKDIDDDGEK